MIRTGTSAREDPGSPIYNQPAMKKFSLVLIILALILALASLTACSKPSAPAASSAPASMPPKSADVSLLTADCMTGWMRT